MAQVKQRLERCIIIQCVTSFCIKYTQSSKSVVTSIAVLTSVYKKRLWLCSHGIKGMLKVCGFEGKNTFV